MKHFYTLLTVLALGALGASAQGLDLQSRATIRRARLEQKSPVMRQRAAYTPAPSTTAAVQQAFVHIAPGYSATDLEAAGMEVMSVRGSIAIVELPLDSAETFASRPCVKAMNLQRRVRPTMDLARAQDGIDGIHEGDPALGIPRAYTGRGVTAGIVDQGLDAHHINFRKADGSPNIRYLEWLRAGAGGQLLRDWYNYTTLDRFTTDNANAYHATHTLGILGGSYTGPVTRAKELTTDDPMAKPEMEQTDNPYGGVAPGADIVAAVGDLQDVIVATGLEYMLGYAEAYRQPAVFSLSLGSTSGPRDLKSTMAQYLDTLGKYAVICISSGNEGDLKLCMRKEFSAGDTTAKSMIFPYYYQYDPEVEGSRTRRSGSVEVWSDDGTPFELKAVIYRRSRSYRQALPMPVKGDGIGSYYCSSADYKLTDNDVVGDPTFCKAFSDGYVGVGSMLDEITGRYYGMVDYYIFNNETTNRDDDYVLGFEVKGHPGQKITCYCDGLTTWLDNYGREGFEDGSTDGTISDMAVAKNLIVVGSYNTRNNWLCLDGRRSRYEGDGFIPGGISGFSSYGTLNDGRQLPTVCGPGAAIISSVSWPYMQQESETFINYACSARVDEEDGRVNLWKQEVGTSMSTPYVAGCIALWLEANPTLNVDDVKEIIAETSIVDDQVRAGDPKRWGAGKFNPLGGLKEAIRRSGAAIEGVETPENNDRLIVTPEGSNRVNLFLGRAPKLNVGVYTAAGSRVMSLEAQGDETTVDLSGLAPGIYIVNVNGRHSAKVSVK